MKRMIPVLLCICLFSLSAVARQPAVPQKPAVPPCPMMGNMQMNCLMAGVMQSMVDVLKIEQKLLVDNKGTDKKALGAELEQKMAVLEKQMADMKCCLQAPDPAVGSQTPPCPMQNGMPCNMTVQPLK
jgi:hypothetical protein